jgi:hypothetical protein
MCFVDQRRHFRGTDVVVERDLDEIDAVEGIRAHGTPRRVRAVEKQELLLRDRGRDRGIEALEVVSRGDDLAPRGQDARPGDASRVDGIAQDDIAVDSGVAVVKPLSRSSRASFAPRSTRALGVIPATASSSPGSNSPLKLMRFTCASCGTITSRSR